MSEMQLIRCSACGATNRVPREKLVLGLKPTCGRCKQPLNVYQPISVTDATFEAEVDRSPVPVLVDAWASWCGPCRTIAPVIDEIAVELAGRMRVAKLNVDENPYTTERFNIQSVPVLLVLKGGREVDRLVGVQSKSEILRRVGRAIA